MIPNIADLESTDPDLYTQVRYYSSMVPFLGDIIRFQDAERSRQDYMDLYGIKWSDMKYPSLTPWAKQGASSVGHISHTSLNYVSKNVLRLYR